MHPHRFLDDMVLLIFTTSNRQVTEIKKRKMDNFEPKPSKNLCTSILSKATTELRIDNKTDKDGDADVLILCQMKI